MVAVKKMAQRGLSKIQLHCWQLGCLFFIILLYSYLELHSIICCSFRLVFTSQLIQVFKTWQGRLRFQIIGRKRRKGHFLNWDGFNIWGLQESRSKLEAEGLTENTQWHFTSWTALSTTDKLRSARCQPEIPWTMSVARLWDSCMSQFRGKTYMISICIFAFPHTQSLLGHS